jgi:hypothetical protein
MHAPATRADRRTELALMVATVELTLITAYVHLTLGGVLFTLNALGYAALAAALAATAIPHPAIRRLAWLPRIGLAGYAAVTIGAYLVVGPYFTLGWVAKGVEIAILTVVAADLVLRYGSPRGLLRQVAATFNRGDRPSSLPA